jgi:hypothetical protein
MAIASIERCTFACGTRGAYVRGCRCAPCTASNAAYQSDRMARRDALEVVQRPVVNGPPIIREFLRVGRPYRLPTCPGLNGTACVVGGAWLKGRRNVGRGYCSACLERVTIFNGLVPADRARVHLLALRRKRVGKIAIAEASGVSALLIGHVMDGRAVHMRADTERRLLEVDESCRLDGSLVPAAKSRGIVKRLFKAGFTHANIAALLRMKTASVQIGDTKFVEAKTQAKLERLWRKVVAKEVAPSRAYADARDEWEQLRELVAIGMCVDWLEERVGLRIRNPERRQKMRVEVLAKVRKLLDKIDGMPRSERMIAWPRYRGEWPKSHDRKRTA